MPFREKLNLTNVTNLWTVFGPGGVVAVIASWAARAADLGWGAAILIGLTLACALMFAAAAVLGAWRYFSPSKEGDKAKSREAEFFPDRPTLIVAHGKLADRFATVSEVDALWVVGLQFYHARENLGIVKRLLLPDPNGEAIKYHLETYHPRRANQFLKDIEQTAQLALDAGAKVKWYKNFVFHSIILADTGKSTGWCHVESVLPYSSPDKRPSFTIYKRDHEDAVLRFQDIYNKIWEEAKDAPHS